MPREVQRVPHAGTVATHRCDATARITNMKVRLATCLFVLLPALGRSSHAGELDLPAPYEPRQAVEGTIRSEEHTSELQSRGHLVCRLLLEKKNKKTPSVLRKNGHEHTVST